MNYKENFEKIMAEQSGAALATSVGDIPNVRIVNFVYDPRQTGVVYFATFRKNQKTAEFDENDTVAFTTIPAGGVSHVRVRNAKIRRSSDTIMDMKDQFVAKIPGYDQTIRYAGNKLELYEIHFHEARVIVDMRSAGVVRL